MYKLEPKELLDIHGQALNEHQKKILNGLMKLLIDDESILRPVESETIYHSVGLRDSYYIRNVLYRLVTSKWIDIKAPTNTTIQDFMIYIFGVYDEDDLQHIFWDSKPNPYIREGEVITIYLSLMEKYRFDIKAYIVQMYYIIFGKYITLTKPTWEQMNEVFTKTSDYKSDTILPKFLAVVKEIKVEDVKNCEVILNYLNEVPETIHDYYLPIEKMLDFLEDIRHNLDLNKCIDSPTSFVDQGTNYITNLLSKMPIDKFGSKKIYCTLLTDSIMFDANLVKCVDDSSLKSKKLAGTTVECELVEIKNVPCFKVDSDYQFPCYIVVDENMATHLSYKPDYEGAAKKCAALITRAYYGLEPLLTGKFKKLVEAELADKEKYSKYIPVETNFVKQYNKLLLEMDKADQQLVKVDNKLRILSKCTPDEKNKAKI
jgi:hypothetical protein